MFTSIVIFTSRNNHTSDQLHIPLTSTNPPKIYITNCIAKGDSGASDHYFREIDKDCLSKVQSFNGPTVTMPNNATLQATERGELEFSKSLSKKARTAVILPGLKSSSLISFGKLCDDDCDILLNRHKMYAVKNDEIVLEGDRNFGDKLWDIPVQKTKLSPSILSTTPQHAGLYSQHYVVMPMIKRKRAPVKSLPPKYQNIFASMDELIQVHECNSIVDNQLKEDRKQVYNHEFARMNAVIDDNIKINFQYHNQLIKPTEY